jgi:molybdenum cofactor cytidylyltransferase
MSRAFAIVPAAGRSERMGRPKLMLPWCESTVIEAVLAAWRGSSVAATVVVVHPEDRELADLCRGAGARVVVPAVPPLDMKSSVLHGIEAITTDYAPRVDDLWALAPADMPWLSAEVIDEMIAAMARMDASILVPTYQGRRGHPVLFRWTLAAEVASLAENEGVNELLKRHPPVEFAWADDSVLGDLDTPDDFAKARGRLPP